MRCPWKFSNFQKVIRLYSDIFRLIFQNFLGSLNLEKYFLGQLSRGHLSYSQDVSNLLYGATTTLYAFSSSYLNCLRNSTFGVDPDLEEKITNWISLGSSLTTLHRYSSCSFLPWDWSLKGDWDGIDLRIEKISKNWKSLAPINSCIEEQYHMMTKNSVQIVRIVLEEGLGLPLFFLSMLPQPSILWSTILVSHPRIHL